MQLRDYPLNKEKMDNLERYAREHSLNISILIENLIDQFLYEQKFISVEDEEEIAPTPSEIYAERKSKFKRVAQQSNVRIYKDNLDFSSFPANDVDEIITKLSYFTDEELKEISKNNWEGSVNKYKQFILKKLENPSLTKTEFVENERLKTNSRVSKTSTIVYIEFKGKQIAQFNTNNYDLENIDRVLDFLKELSDDEINELESKRKRQNKLNSAEFYLKEIESHVSELNSHTHTEEVIVKRKYMVFRESGNVGLYRQGHSYGTHRPEKIEEVWMWLNDRDWDTSFATDSVHLKNKKYLDWLYGEMSK